MFFIYLFEMSTSTDRMDKKSKIDKKDEPGTCCLFDYDRVDWGKMFTDSKKKRDKKIKEINK